MMILYVVLTLVILEFLGVLNTVQLFNPSAMWRTGYLNILSIKSWFAKRP